MKYTGRKFIKEERDRVFPDSFDEIYEFIRKLPNDKVLFIFDKEKKLKVYITKHKNKYMAQFVPSISGFKSDEEIDVRVLARKLLFIHAITVFADKEFFFKIEDITDRKELASPAGGNDIPNNAKGLLELFLKIPEGKEVFFFNNNEGRILGVKRQGKMYHILLKNDREFWIRQLVDIRGINKFIGHIRGKDKPKDRVRFVIDFPDEGGIVAENIIKEEESKMIPVRDANQAITAIGNLKHGFTLTLLMTKDKKVVSITKTRNGYLFYVYKYGSQSELNEYDIIRFIQGFFSRHEETGASIPLFYTIDDHPDDTTVIAENFIMKTKQLKPLIKKILKEMYGRRSSGTEENIEIELDSSIAPGLTLDGGEIEVGVTIEYESTPYTPATGMYGPPEHSSPAEGGDFNIIDSYPIYVNIGKQQIGFDKVPEDQKQIISKAVDSYVARHEREIGEKISAGAGDDFDEPPERDYPDYDR